MREISWLSSFKTVGGIKSGPVALCGFKLASNFWMPGVDIVMFGIEGEGWALCQEGGQVFLS